MEVLKLHPFDQYGSLVEIVKLFGGKQKYLEALKELKQQIYTSA
jgi:type I restriction enzyme R subunit